MNDTASIEKRLMDLVCHNLRVKEDEVKMDSSLVNDLGADSLDVIELAMAIEEEFDIEIPDEDAEKMNTYKDVLDYVLAQSHN